MHPSYRALFLIAAGLTVLHVSPLKTLIVLLGYLVFEWVDERVAFIARLKKLDILDEIIFE
jgi:protein-S-isoprenylcysteine O-methyltransferase Ste14